MKKFDALFLNTVITILFFCVGIWIFNHFPLPVVGVIIAISYPIYLIRKFIIERL